MENENKSIAELQVEKVDKIVRGMQKVFLEELRELGRREGVSLLAVLSIGVTEKTIGATKGALGILCEKVPAPLLIDFINDCRRQLAQQEKVILIEHLDELFKNYLKK
jgi:hypothetical protein